MGVDVAEGDQPESQGAATDARPAPVGPRLRPVRLEGLVLLDSAAAEPVAVEAIVFADDGIGVVHNRGERPRTTSDRSPGPGRRRHRHRTRRAPLPRNPGWRPGP